MAAAVDHMQEEAAYILRLPPSPSFPSFSSFSSGLPSLLSVALDLFIAMLLRVPIISYLVSGYSFFLHPSLTFIILFLLSVSSYLSSTCSVYSPLWCLTAQPERNWSLRF